MSLIERPDREPSVATPTTPVERSPVGHASLRERTVRCSKAVDVRAAAGSMTDGGIVMDPSQAAGMDGLAARGRQGLAGLQPARRFAPPAAALTNADDGQFIQINQWLDKWRRGRDSNPRYRFKPV